MADLEAKRTSIANRLRVAREMAGLTQGQAARIVRIHRPSVSEAEAGRRRVSAEEVAEFARIYGVSVSWLVSGGPGSTNRERDRIELAARKLSGLKRRDLDRLLEVIDALKRH